MARTTELFTLRRATIVRETAAAILVLQDGDEEDESIWIPTSQVDQITRLPEGATIVMSAWIAKKKGLL